MSPFKPPFVLFPAIIGGFCFGFAGTQLAWHNYWAALGFTLAALLSLLLHVHISYIQKLLLANHIQSVSMQRFMHDLEEAGVVVTHVETEGDVDTTTVQIVRKDLH